MLQQRHSRNKLNENLEYELKIRHDGFITPTLSDRAEMEYRQLRRWKK
jgi:hypothetical protein